MTDEQKYKMHTERQYAYLSINRYYQANGVLPLCDSEDLSKQVESIYNCNQPRCESHIKIT